MQAQSPQRRLASEKFRIENVRNRILNDQFASNTRKDVHKNYNEFVDQQFFNIPERKASKGEAGDNCFHETVKYQNDVSDRLSREMKDASKAQHFLLHQSSPMCEYETPKQSLEENNDQISVAHQMVLNNQQKQAFRPQTAPVKRKMKGEQGQSIQQQLSQSQTSKFKKVLPQSAFQRPKASIVKYKEKITEQQRNLFQINVNNQQLFAIDQLNNQLINKENSSVQKHLAECKNMQDDLNIRIDKIQVETELLDVHILQAKQSIKLLQEQIKADEQKSIETDQKIALFVPIKNLDDVYDQYAFIDVKQIIQDIDVHEHNLVKNMVSIQDQDEHIQAIEQQIKVQKDDFDKKMQQQQVLTNQNRKFMVQKIEQLELLNRNLKQDTFQSEQARFKSVRLNNAIIQFNKAWGHILDYNFLTGLSKVNNQQTYDDLRKNLFRVQKNARKYVETQQSTAYKKLAKLILQIYREYPEKPYDLNKEIDESITQDIPAISQYICQTSVKQAESIVKLQLANKTLTEEIQKLNSVGQEIDQWNQRVSRQYDILSKTHGNK